RMFKWLFTGALALSIGLCGWHYWQQRQKIDDTGYEIERKQIEIQRVQAIVNEVLAYQKQKDALQIRIDIINQQKQNQKGPAPAIAQLANVDPASIDSVAVIGGKDLVINRR